jgi:hypothetical protein
VSGRFPCHHYNRRLLRNQGPFTATRHGSGLSLTLTAIPLNVIPTDSSITAVARMRWVLPARWAQAVFGQALPQSGGAPIDVVAADDEDLVANQGVALAWTGPGNARTSTCSPSPQPCISATRSSRAGAFSTPFVGARSTSRRARALFCWPASPSVDAGSTGAGYSAIRTAVPLTDTMSMLLDWFWPRSMVS